MGSGNLDPVLVVYERKAGDRYLLCSDGLSSVLTSKEIKYVLNSIISSLELDNLDEEDKVILCPNCSSKNIASGFRSMKGIMGIVSMFIAFMLTVFPIYTNYVYRCNDCDEEFKLKAKKS